MAFLPNLFEVIERNPELDRYRDQHPEAVPLMQAHFYLADAGNGLMQLLKNAGGEPLPVIHAVFEGPLAQVRDALLDTGAGHLAQTFGAMAEHLLTKQQDAANGPFWKQIELVECIISLARWSIARTYPMARDAPRFVVEVAARRVIIDGHSHSVSSVEALAFAKKLVDHRGTVQHSDGDKKPGKLLKMLPQQFRDSCRLTGSGPGSGYKFLG